MTLRELNIAIMRDQILGKLLPLELRRTYPQFSLEGETLFASFVGFRAAPGQNAVRVFPPVYYLKITCPQCAMYSFERFSVGADDSGEHLMTPRNAEDIKRLAEMCDKSLELYAQKADGLETAISEYNALLKTILEPEQLAVLDKYAN